MSKNNIDFLYEKDYFLKDFDVTHKVNKKLSFETLTDSVVVPYKLIDGKINGGIVTKDGEFIENSSLHAKCGVGTLPREDEIEISDEPAIYLGLFVKIWGHCITDNLRRLWFLTSETFQKNFKNYKIIFVPQDGFSFGSNFKSLLDIFGINPDVFVPITKATRFHEIILPDESFFTLDGNIRYFTDEYSKMIEKIREFDIKNFKKLDYDKVYFTYARCSGFKQIGENRLEQFFSKQGYKIIAPEQYSFYEQLNILLNCNYFASTIGSCSHNIMFLNEGSNAILIPRANYLTGYQLAINEVTNLNITWIQSDLSIMVPEASPWDGPFFYFVSRNLLKFFNCTDTSFLFSKKDLKNFKNYLLLGSMFLKDLKNSPAPTYYQKVLMQCIEDFIETSTIHKKIKTSKLMKRIFKLKLKLFK